MQSKPPTVDVRRLLNAVCGHDWTQGEFLAFQAELRAQGVAVAEGPGPSATQAGPHAAQEAPGQSPAESSPQEPSAPARDPGAAQEPPRCEDCRHVLKPGWTLWARCKLHRVSKDVIYYAWVARRPGGTLCGPEGRDFQPKDTPPHLPDIVAHDTLRPGDRGMSNERTVRVRIAVGVTPNGCWSAEGGKLSPTHFDHRPRAQVDAHMAQGASSYIFREQGVGHVVFIEADVPLPSPFDATPIRAEVVP